MRFVSALGMALAAFGFLAAAALPVAGQSRSQDEGSSNICKTGRSQPRLLVGLEPEVIDDMTIGLHSGHFTDASGCMLASFDRMVRIQLNRSGLNGMDGGPPRPGTHYFIYIVGTRDGQVGAIVSSEIAISEVNRGGRFAFARKLPWGFVFTGKGVQPMHISYWPKPFTRYTDARSSPEWSVLQNGAASEWTIVDVSRLVPDNARMAYLIIEVRSTGDRRPAAGFIRVVGTQGDGLMVGRVNNGASNTLTLQQRITSKGQFFYRVEPGAVMQIHVLGYSNTEPS